MFTKIARFTTISSRNSHSLTMMHNIPSFLDGSYNDSTYVTQQDIDELTSLETGGRLELQEWMYGKIDMELSVSSKQSLEDLISIETQGRVGFIVDRK